MVTEEKRSKLVSEPNYHTKKHFPENVLAKEIKKTKVIMNKPVSLGMSILDISKTLMYKFWYELNQNMETEQIFAIWILITLLFIL